MDNPNPNTPATVEIHPEYGAVYRPELLNYEPVELLMPKGTPTGTELWRSVMSGGVPKYFSQTEQDAAINVNKSWIQPEIIHVDYYPYEIYKEKPGNKEYHRTLKQAEKKMVKDFPNQQHKYFIAAQTVDPPFTVGDIRKREEKRAKELNSEEYKSKEELYKLDRKIAKINEEVNRRENRYVKLIEEEPGEKKADLYYDAFVRPLHYPNPKKNMLALRKWNKYVQRREFGKSIIKSNKPY